MKALILGADGQVGRSLVATAPAQCEVVALGSRSLDITDAVAATARIAAERPQVVFNAAAYTAVDQAESDEPRALAVNATAVGHLAAAARAHGARLVHLSTDFVFDGTGGIPYAPDAAPNPLSAYGRTKLAGERLVGDDALIVRTAWVYAASGRNFLLTMLGLLRDRHEVRVVADQIGTPTFAPGLAAALWRLAGTGAKGLHHYADAGAASWYDFAVAIQEEALAAGLLHHKVPIVPIATREYPTPAQRPSYSVLDKWETYAVLGAPAPHWRSNLRVAIATIKGSG